MDGATEGNEGNEGNGGSEGNGESEGNGGNDGNGDAKRRREREISTGGSLIEIGGQRRRPQKEISLRLGDQQKKVKREIRCGDAR